MNCAWNSTDNMESRQRTVGYGRAHRRVARFSVGVIALLLSFVGPLAHALKSDADQPINIRARSIEANEKTGVSIYKGNVVLTQGSLRVEADRLEVTLRNGQTDLIRAWGKPVRMHSRTDAGEEIRAKAARVEYHGPQRRIDLYGDAELKRDADVFNGAVVHYALDDQRFSAEGGDGGQVSAVLQPAKREAAP
jgi:lipopolysaccharide export system protein LptA